MTIIEYVLKDIKAPGSYIPTGIVVGLAVCLLANIMNKFIFTHNMKPNEKMVNAIEQKSACITVSGLYTFISLQIQFRK